MENEKAKFIEMNKETVMALHIKDTITTLGMLASVNGFPVQIILLTLPEHHNWQTKGYLFSNQISKEDKG